MPVVFVEDGYGRRDLFVATKRHGDLEISYRPMARGERNRLAMTVSRLIDAKKEDEATKATATALASKLEGWHSPDWRRIFIKQFVPADSGEPAVVAGNIELIEPNLFEKVYRAVAGYDDEDVDVSAVEAKEDADAKN
jgi:hypothetical protein